MLQLYTLQHHTHTHAHPVAGEFNVFGGCPLGNYCSAIGCKSESGWRAGRTGRPRIPRHLNLMSIHSGSCQCRAAQMQIKRVIEARTPTTTIYAIHLLRSGCATILNPIHRADNAMRHIQTCYTCIHSYIHTYKYDARTRLLDLWQCKMLLHH